MSREFSGQTLLLCCIQWRTLALGQCMRESDVQNTIGFCFFPHCATQLLTNYSIRLFIDPRGGLPEDSLQQTQAISVGLVIYHLV